MHKSFIQQATQNSVTWWAWPCLCYHKNDEQFPCTTCSTSNDKQKTTVKPCALCRTLLASYGMRPSLDTTTDLNIMDTDLKIILKLSTNVMPWTSVSITYELEATLMLLIIESWSMRLSLAIPFRYVETVQNICCDRSWDYLLTCYNRHTCITSSIKTQTL
jgi:hypothetical protein